MISEASAAVSACATSTASRQKAERVRRLNVAIGRVLAGMKPPENLTVSEWAEKKRRLSSESSAEIGPYRVSRTPYLREIMDAFTAPKIHRIVVVASSQVGKTEMEMNMIGYMMDVDPGPAMWVLPSSCSFMSHPLFSLTLFLYSSGSYS